VALTHCLPESAVAAILTVATVAWKRVEPGRGKIKM